MRALIMAGGADEKWTSLGGKGRRHFQLVNGEQVIGRLVRQLRERGVRPIGVIHPAKIARYRGIGDFGITPTYTEWGHEALNGQAYWDESDRTILVYGDLVATDAAMDTIVGFNRRVFQAFGSFGRGAVKGGGGELFALSFWPEQREDFHDALEAVFALKARGIIRRAGSWEAYRYMAGARGPRVGLHRLYAGYFTRINDGRTDDFDRPDQFVKLKALFERGPRHTKPDRTGTGANAA